ncbi:hypothetical protein MB02_12150 [Croceicoccus estronivorus]|nr:hypothetical protein MB02_12150 [Croceicoccus estronivorus]
MLAGCGNRVEDRQGRGDPPAYVAGLGEIMGLNQMRHAKLWFAGKAENWPLAAYEIDEIREGFGDAERYHPRHKTVPEPMRQMIEEYVDGPLAHLDGAVRKQDNVAFITAFDDLTQGCNACHRASGFGYNVVTRPTSPPYSNQSFAPAEADANGTG